MKRTKLLWQIYPPMLMILIIAMAGITWYGGHSLRDFFVERTGADLKVRLEFVRERIVAPLAAGDYAGLQKICRNLGQQSGSRITVVLPSGRVVADSLEEPERLDNHGDRFEIIAALAGETGKSRRFSRTLQQNLLYVAEPVVSVDSNVTIGVLRLALPVTAIETQLRQVAGQVLPGGLVLIILAGLVILVVTRRLTEPIEAIRQGTERFAEGRFDRQINFARKARISSEVAELASAINLMARQLSERINTVSEQRNELGAVFACMIEAVLVFDPEERFLSINQAAMKLLGLTSAEVVDKTVVEVIRNPQLIRFVHSILAQDEPREEELILRDGGRDVYLQAHGTRLIDYRGKTMGALVVLNDLTRLKRLENIRRDFVANVSHELKTPITTIKGFAETLCDGALDQPEEARRFTEIIRKNADRLGAIVNDLLTLSRIENEEEQGEIELARQPLREELEEVVETCLVKAQQKKIDLRLECPEGLVANLNGPLLQQAVANLVVNAIKYSEAGQPVTISAIGEGDSVRLKVVDHGCGIAAEHLPRLFERFYRSDKARSRKLGGTGLGLAIVKHIVQAHDGEVNVRSEVGKGTTFEIILPAG